MNSTIAWRLWQRCRDRTHARLSIDAWCQVNTNTWVTLRARFNNYQDVVCDESA